MLGDDAGGGVRARWCTRVMGVQASWVYSNSRPGSSTPPLDVSFFVFVVQTRRLRNEGRGKGEGVSWRRVLTQEEEDKDSHAVPRKLLLDGSFHCGLRAAAWAGSGCLPGRGEAPVTRGWAPMSSSSLRGSCHHPGAPSRHEEGEGTWEFRTWSSGRGHAVSAATLRGSMGSE